MALRIGWKRPAEGGEGDQGKGLPPFEPQPEKAQRWFRHARQSAESFQYDYALNSFAEGIRLDPGDRAAHEEMYEAAVRYSGQGGKPASGREVKKFEGPHPVDRFAAAEFAWMKDLNSASAALRFLECAARAEPWAGEIGRWHAPRVLTVLRRQKKPSKSSLVQARDLLAELGAWDEALAAGDAALQLDPADAQLEAELKDLSAQRAMAKGRYEEAGGTEGGYLRMVRDLERQRELEERGSIAGGASMDQRNLERARRDYEQSPGVPENINTYAQLLRAQGTPEAEEKAWEVAMKGYQDTGQYRFRAFAGDIRVEQSSRRVAALRDKMEGGDGEARAAWEQAHRQHLDLRLAEVSERAREYPTDRTIRYQLGEIEFERARYTNAMQCFQEVKDEPRLRVRAGHMLGRCFAAENWHKEAIAEYQEALERIEPGAREVELQIRYDLMVSLMAHARDERSRDLALQALEICSSIARKDITYRDIRDCRRQLDELVRQLNPQPQEG